MLISIIYPDSKYQLRISSSLYFVFDIENLDEIIDKIAYKCYVYLCIMIFKNNATEYSDIKDQVHDKKRNREHKQI